MPTYDFHCEKCDAIFEVRASIKEKDVGLNPVCPQCHSSNVQQLITAGLLLHGSGNMRSSFAGCDPNAKGGCCQ